MVFYTKGAATNGCAHFAARILIVFAGLPGIRSNASLGDKLLRSAVRKVFWQQLIHYAGVVQ